MKNSLFCVAFIMSLSGFSRTLPISLLKENSKPASTSDLRLATDYLQQFYNLKVTMTNRTKRSTDLLSETIKEMQHFFHLNITGTLDTETVEVMKTPRCGVPDVHNYSPNGEQPKWYKNVLTYSISQYTYDMPPAVVDSVIDSALKVWSTASPLSFVRTYSSNADIIVQFASYAHGDSFPFDGPKGTLAHAFGPGNGIGGDTHFDDDELWTTGMEGFNLYLVAAHEFGHALGLSHSRNPSSLMYPTYKKRNTGGNLLSGEDIAQIQTLYGPRSGLQYFYPKYNMRRLFFPWSLQSIIPLNMQDKCDLNLSFDAVTDIGQDILFVKNRYLWIRHEQGPEIKEGRITDFIPEINSDIDAAYTSGGLIYLFKRSRYWTVKKSHIKGRSKSIYMLGFPYSVKKIDAAVNIKSTGNTLFFVNKMYWSYNETAKSMEMFYPRYITDDFPGLNTTIDAAFEKNGFLHFFVGSAVHKYNYNEKSIVETKKANSWLGC
ncbi:matrix metalloproteinase-20 [Polypterus senegalus]|uniref:matrix metalloproteinase-20 n=1 Tax=Polypterus senegalus TaxID=55291 RepID=UPI001963B49F|nr:matrix metalloproteinase-20 [Polypterus senegalus]